MEGFVKTNNQYDISVNDMTGGSYTFTSEGVEYVSTKYVTLDELRDILENYCKEFYEKHGCQPVSKELQMKLKSEISNILSNYTVDNVLTTKWEVDVVPIDSGFKINVYGHNGNLNWGVSEISFKAFKVRRMISKEVFNQIIENGPNDVFIDNAGIIWEFCEIKRNKPVYKKVWVIDGNKYDYTEDYNELVKEVDSDVSLKDLWNIWTSI